MNDKHKTALLWGPVSSFTGPLTAWLTKKGWHVDIACKSSLNLLSLSPLDLKSAARGLIESSYKSHNKAKAFADKYRFIDQSEALKNTKYDTIVFAGLPPNFDESRGPRAPWSAQELDELLKSRTEETDIIVVSSIYAAVQEDGVVPEEYSFQKRKALSNWENTCQQYENKLIDVLTRQDLNWSLVRMPLICGATDDGKTIKNNGLHSLFNALNDYSKSQSSTLRLRYSPDATLWFLPIDTSVYIFWRYMEDKQRPKILNMVPTNPSLNREWLSHLSSVLKIDKIEESKEQDIEIPSIVTKLLTDNVQVSTRNLYEAAGKYHIPPVITDAQYFAKILDVVDTEIAQANSGGTAFKGHVNTEKLTKLYFEEFLPSTLNTDGFLDKAILKGKDIGFRIKEASEDIWILKSADGTSIAEKEKLTAEKSLPAVCFKLSVDTLLKLLEKKLPLTRALLLRKVEVAGNPIRVMKVVRLIEKSFNENTLSKDQLENVLA